MRYLNPPRTSLRVRNSTPLGPYPARLTERLRHWAVVAPDRVFLASREGWQKVTYLEALNSVCAIGQALLDRGLSVTRPVLILSGNGIEPAFYRSGGGHTVCTSVDGLLADFKGARGMAAPWWRCPQRLDRVWWNVVRVRSDRCLMTSDRKEKQGEHNLALHSADA